MTKTLIRTGSIVMLLSVTPLLAQKPEAPETLLQTAIKKEIVDGDLAGAIKGYRNAFEAAKGNHSIAATALLHMADCYQKLGSLEAGQIYTRIVNEFADQKGAALEARKKLSSSGEASANIVSSRRVWTAIPKTDFGKVSLDGRYIPYTDWNEKGDLFVHDLKTGANRRLTNSGGDFNGGSQEFGEEAVFSRDNKQLAYTWDLGNNGGAELRLISMQDSGIPHPRTLVAGGDLAWISGYDWSPDNRFIAAYIQRKDRTVQIGLVSVQTGSFRPLKSLDKNAPTGIFFSPDGEYLAYDLPTDAETGNRDVFVISSEGNREITAVASPNQDAIVGWAPDGKHLVFASDRSGSMDLWAIGFENGKIQGPPERLRRGVGSPEHFENLGMTLSGAQYSEIGDGRSAGPDIQIAELDLSHGRFLSQPIPAAKTFLGTNAYPAWSPDGKYLAYASFRDSYVAIGIRSIETGQVREIVPSSSFDASVGHFSSLIWGVEGKSFIVAATNKRDGNGIFKIDAQTGETSVIVRAEGPRIVGLSPDGLTLYYWNQERADGDATIFKRDLASGQENVLLRRKAIGGLANMISPGGRYIKVLAGTDDSTNSSSLMLLPTTGGEPRELVRDAGPGLFSPDGRYIATVQLLPRAASTVALLIPIDGAQPKQLMSFPQGTTLYVTMWSPDSQFVFLRAVNADQSVVWRAPINGDPAQKVGSVSGSGSFFVSPDWRRVAIAFASQSTSKFSEIWAMENLFSAISKKPSSILPSRPVQTQNSVPEIVTIQATDPTFADALIQFPRGSFSMRGFTLKDIIGFAYGTHSSQILGVPKLLESERYDVVAKADKPLTPDESGTSEAKKMLQSILADHFHLKFHRETREIPTYVLSVAKDGHKMTEAAGPSALNIQGANISARSATVASLIESLQLAVDRPIIDRTGLTATFNFDLHWRPDSTQFGGRGGQFPAASDPNRADLFTAMLHQLGLRLEPQNSATNVIIVDQAEKPAGN